MAGQSDGDGVGFLSRRSRRTPAAEASIGAKGGVFIEITENRRFQKLEVFFFAEEKGVVGRNCVDQVVDLLGAVATMKEFAILGVTAATMFT